MSFSDIKHYFTRDVVTLFVLGIASGLPLFLVFGTLSVWLTEAGAERTTIGFLSWAGLSYGFKFIWAPLVDSLPVPWLTAKLGRRKGWIILSQLMVVVALLTMASMNPAASYSQFIGLAAGAVLLGFSSATQDIVIDAYRIDIAPPEYQALLAGVAVAGYRVGMIIGGAGALEISGLFGEEGVYISSSWQTAYVSMAAVMTLLFVFTLTIKEPAQHSTRFADLNFKPLPLFVHFLLMVAVFVAVFILFGQWLVLPQLGLSGGALGVASFFYEALKMAVSLLSAIVVGRSLVQQGWVGEAVFQRVYVSPFTDFFTRYGRLALWLILLICFYRVADIVMGVMAKVFYTNLGYSKVEIGRVTVIFGLWVTIAGGIIGGVMSVRWGVLPILLLGAVCSALSNLMFVFLAGLSEPSVPWLTVAIICDNLSGGLATATGVAFLSVLLNRQFGATQYAAFSSIIVLMPKLIAGYSGQMVDAMGYESFFMLTAAMGIPVILLILKVWRPLQLQLQGQS